MKMNKLYGFIVAAVTLGMTGCMDTDAQYTIPEVAAPVVVKTTPAEGETQVKRGDITIQVEFDKNIFFASEDVDQLLFEGGTLLSAEVIGSSSVLTVKVNAPDRESVCKLTVPAGVVIGPNRMPAPEVTLSFQTTAYDKQPVAATTESAKKLYNYLLENIEQNTLSGMMAKGAWNTEMSERVHTWTGKYPALNTFDYGHLHWSISGANWINYADITPVKNWADANGIVSCMWHWNVPKVNPAGTTPDLSTGYAFYKAETNFDATNATIEGTWENTVFTEDLESVAVYLRLLKDADIPVLWRPFHEAAGGWFWWGKDAASFKKLWIAMFDYFREQGLNNLIWVWTTETGDDAWYPGNQYVDIIGRDIYEKDATVCAEQYAQIAASYGNKMVVLSECGSVGKVSEQWTAGARWGWFMPWYDGTGDNDEPIVHANEEWWQDAMNQNYVITRDQVPSMR